MSKKKSCQIPIIFTIISFVILVLGIILFSVGIQNMPDPSQHPWNFIAWANNNENLNGTAIAGSSLMSLGFFMLMISLIFWGICYSQ